VTSHGSRHYVVDWIRAGIPVEAIIAPTIGRIVKSFQPTDSNPQISSMRYFDRGVRQAWDEARALPDPGSEATRVTDEMPRSPAKRSGKLTRTDGAETVDEQTAVESWMRDHPGQTAEIREELRQDLEQNEEWTGLAEPMARVLLEAKLRKAVRERAGDKHLRLVKP
jgi:hypothetical protein